MKNTSLILQKLLRRIGRYRILLFVSVLLSLFCVLLTLYLPLLIGRAIDCLIGPSQVDFAGIGQLLVRALWVIAVTSLLNWVISTLNNRLAYHVVKDLRNEAFARLQRLPLSYLDVAGNGDLLSRIITDTDQVSDGLLMGFTQLATGAFTILGTLFFMLRLHAGMAGVVIVLTPLSVLVASFIANRTHHLFVRQSIARGELTDYTDEMIAGRKLVAAFTREQEVAQDFDRLNDKLRDCSTKAVFFSSLTNPCTRFVNALVYAVVALCGGLFAIVGGISVGGLACFLSYANQYTKPFNDISSVVAELQNALACAGRVLELIEQPTETPDDDLPDLPPARGAIEATQVCFSYVPGRPLIEHLNLTVTPGQRIAIVGPTGCGKTTLINLLMRFYDVNSGVLSVDGHDIRRVNRTSLRHEYGMVLQETWLKNASVRENLLMAKEDATGEELADALKKAHADGFVGQLPNGIDTVLGEDGGSLSGGQKQLLCIARILLRLPPMLILDEATSSIDTRTEQRIQDAFAELMKGRTTFVVAHRLSTIKNADRILVMNNGHIMEQGTHKELLKKNGFYAKLYNSQFEQVTE